MLKFSEYIAQLAGENSRRTALGIYPPLYGAGQYPPLDNMTHGAGALFSMLKIHGIEDHGDGKVSTGTKTLKKHKSSSKKKHSKPKKEKKE